MENKVCLIEGFVLQSLTSGCRGLPIQDEKRPTTDMGGDFLEKTGFYNTLFGRGCLLQSKCGF